MSALPALSPPDIASDYLEGAGEIAAFLGPKWTARRVYHARETKSLPIRTLPGKGGIYALKSELVAAFKAPETVT